MNSPVGRPPRLELIDGRARIPAIGDLTLGERHGIEHEIDRRLIRRLAERLSHLLQNEAADRCDLAVSAPIHHQFLDEVRQDVLRMIDRVLPADLSHIPPNEILGHFDRAA